MRADWVGCGEPSAQSVAASRKLSRYPPRPDQPSGDRWGLAAVTQFTVTTRTPQLLVRPHSFRNLVAAHTVKVTPSVDGIPPFIPTASRFTVRFTVNPTRLPAIGRDSHGKVVRILIDDLFQKVQGTAPVSTLDPIDLDSHR
jgi:hypothetical protein